MHSYITRYTHAVLKSSKFPELFEFMTFSKEYFWALHDLKHKTIMQNPNYKTCYVNWISRPCDGKVPVFYCLVFNEKVQMTQFFTKYFW